LQHSHTLLEQNYGKGKYAEDKFMPKPPIRTTTGVTV